MMMRMIIYLPKKEREMKKFIYAIFFSFISLCLFTVPVSAKIRSVGTINEMQRSIDRSKILVALFYDNSPTKKDLMHMYQQVSDIREYDEADIVFAVIDVERKELVPLM